MELPEWATAVPGFDPSGDWLPIVCTDKGKHVLTLLDVYYDHAEGAGWFVTAQHCRRSRIRPEYEGTPGQPGWRQSNEGAGSINIECPVCGPGDRVPRDEWHHKLEEAARASDPFVDVSL